MDRWSIVSTLNYLEHEAESNIVLGKVPSYQASDDSKRVIGNMVSVAELTRKGFVNGDVSTVMSPRTVLTWAQNAEIFGDVGFGLPGDVLKQVRRTGAGNCCRVLPALHG